MKEIPKKTPLKSVAFLDGAKGWASQVYTNDELGVTVTMTRKNRDSQFTRAITCNGIEGEFETIEALNEAIRATSEPQ